MRALVRTLLIVTPAAFALVLPSPFLPIAEARAQDQGDACGIEQPASPKTRQKASIRFTNDTMFAYRIYWANFDGVLAEYALAQPDEHNGFDTYAGHEWYVEIYTPNGSVCLGPIAAPAGRKCDMHIVDDGTGEFGLEGRGCNY
ncbi:hypothetical protein [Affinirhizobium pseudoryzae]|uniref:hypothetical protein n=1 Tax=Allorhizobium pseudoryzae TaxID=379684 RepID=UPI0013ECDAEF|nr:hypothetical protein [Allorhizobium pseudoryzae]